MYNLDYMTYHNAKNTILTECKNILCCMLITVKCNRNRNVIVLIFYEWLFEVVLFSPYTIDKMAPQSKIFFIKKLRMIGEL